MFYLVLITPLVILGFLLTMQIFETWLLGHDRPQAKDGALPGRSD
jgi:hypothetical protein